MSVLDMRHQIHKLVDTLPATKLAFVLDFLQFVAERETMADLAHTQTSADQAPEFWKLIDIEPLPSPPPATPEGDEIALAALNKVRGSSPITDPELGRWIAESEESAIYNIHLYGGQGATEPQE
ncbi:MAG: hypothetical protein PVF45_12275 [Anaerolineae bacterium]